MSTLGIADPKLMCIFRFWGSFRESIQAQCRWFYGELFAIGSTPHRMCNRFLLAFCTYLFRIWRLPSPIWGRALPQWQGTLLTYSMVQSPSWAADWFAASQEIPRISRNPKVHYRTHKRTPGDLLGIYYYYYYYYYFIFIICYATFTHMVIFLIGKVAYRLMTYLRVRRRSLFGIQGNRLSQPQLCAAIACYTWHDTISPPIKSPSPTHTSFMISSSWKI